MQSLRVINAMFGRGLGGIEQALVDYHDALSLAGHTVINVIDPDAAIRHSLQQRNIPFTTVSNAGAWDVVAMLKLRRMARDVKPDISIAHGNRALSLLRFGVGTRRLVAPAHNYNIKYDGVAGVFCATKDAMRHARARGVQEAKIFFVPNMVRLEERASRGWHQPPVIGTMGRFVAKKGFDVFLQALAVLRARDIAFRAVLAGGGEEERRLKVLSQSLGLEDILSFPGWVTDKKAFFDTIDVFCLPSHHEPFGIVLLEAMAERLPVVASRSEGPAEIVSDGQDGLLFHVADADDCADKLAQLLTRRVFAEKLGNAAYTTVRAQYDVPVVSAKMQAALQTMS